MNDDTWICALLTGDLKVVGVLFEDDIGWEVVEISLVDQRGFWRNELKLDCCWLMDVVIYVIKDDIGLFMETKLLDPVEEYCESVEDVEEEEVMDCELKEEVSGV